MDPNKEYVAYPVSFSNVEIAEAVRILEEASLAIEDRDLRIVASLVLVLCLSDPSLPQEERRFQYAMESLSNHLVWTLQQGTHPVPPELMN